MIKCLKHDNCNYLEKDWNEVPFQATGPIFTRGGKPMSENKELRVKIKEALAKGYCTKENEKKELDAVLCSTQSEFIFLLIHADRQRWLKELLPKVVECKESFEGLTKEQVFMAGQMNVLCRTLEKAGIKE
jgi:hypothetical protein